VSVIDKNSLLSDVVIQTGNAVSTSTVIDQISVWNHLDSEQSTTVFREKSGFLTYSLVIVILPPLYWNSTFCGVNP